MRFTLSGEIANTLAPTFHAVREHCKIFSVFEFARLVSAYGVNLSAVEQMSVAFSDNFVYESAAQLRRIIIKNDSCDANFGQAGGRSEINTAAIHDRNALRFAQIVFVVDRNLNSCVIGMNRLNDATRNGDEDYEISPR